MHVQRLKISTDCLKVANIIQLKGEDKGRNGKITNEGVTWAHKFVDARFCHESRTANGEAHNLARSATKMEAGRLVWFIQPPEFLCIPRNICSQ